MEIVEYHCCADCRHALIIPHDVYGNDELVCLERHDEVNHTGGLSNCTFFNEKD